MRRDYVLVLHALAVEYPVIDGSRVDSGWTAHRLAKFLNDKYEGKDFYRQKVGRVLSSWRSLGIVEYVEELRTWKVVEKKLIAFARDNDGSPETGELFKEIIKAYKVGPLELLGLGVGRG